ncbi:glutamate-rich protein 6 isoform X3 [Struthio camelus]|uniref:glutamate-rich protein 6 isoform X3 n=1 Tax=Struthio camelus TaxID=8801 RepID=UPI0036040587
MEGADGPGRSPPDRGSEEKSDGSKESGSETSLQGHTEQPPPEKDSLSSDSTKGHLSILEGVRRETSFPSLHRLGRETETSDSVNPTTPMKALGASVSMQTEASWLYKQLYKKSTLSEELSSLDILCDLEFKVDFVRLFKKSLCTLPSVGPPTLLAYRPESSRENIQIKLGEDCVPRCEYCGNLLKLFPSFEDVCPPTQDYKSKFCCERNQELYEFILNERKNLEAAWSSPIAIGPHESRGNESERLLAKERAYQRQQERQMAKQLAFLATEQTTLPDYSSELDTISYLLSREPPSPSSRTLMPGEKAAKPKEERIYYSITCCDFTVVSGKLVKNEFLEKYYKHGGKFLTILPDRTAQLFYPSGNLAIIVVRETKQFVCIVQEDKPNNAGIQAVFQSNGRSTCYHPNGTVWININIQGGQYLDQAGSRVRTWTWPNTVTSSGPHAPLRPVFISLNRHVGVRILGQDKIAVSFLAMGQQAKFNVGTKVQVSAVDQLPPPSQLSEDHLLLLAFRIRIWRLFNKLHGCLTFPSNEQWDKIKPPAYLTTQALKIIHLCMTSDVSEEVRSLGWMAAQPAARKKRGNSPVQRRTKAPSLSKATRSYSSATFRYILGTQKAVSIRQHAGAAASWQYFILNHLMQWEGGTFLASSGFPSCGGADSLAALGTA